jgi:hypothetical protein
MFFLTNFDADILSDAPIGLARNVISSPHALVCCDEPNIENVLEKLVRYYS